MHIEVEMFSATPKNQRTFSSKKIDDDVVELNLSATSTFLNRHFCTQLHYSPVW